MIGYQNGADDARGVDLHEYPIHAPTLRQRLVRERRRQIADEGCAILPGFVTAPAVQRMVKDVQAALPNAHRRDLLLGAYGDPGDEAMPDGHPRRHKSPYRMWTIATDDLRQDSALVSLYEWEPLTTFIGEMLGDTPLYRVADPMLRCAITVLREGDQHGWHFDDNDFVVSLLLQAPEQGGAFEFAPGIRSTDHENYESVSCVLKGEPGRTRLRVVSPGSLMVFCGKQALHRVTEVHGKRERIIALFSFDREPGMTYSRETRRNAVGRETPRAD
jgi:hypothetical protein